MFFQNPKWAGHTTFSHRNVELILAKMRENLALLYGFSHFRQASPGIPCENTCYVRLETDFISQVTRQVLFSTRATRWLYLSSRSHVEDELFLSTPITISLQTIYLFQSNQRGGETTYVGFIITYRIQGHNNISLQKHHELDNLLGIKPLRDVAGKSQTKTR